MFFPRKQEVSTFQVDPVITYRRQGNMFITVKILQGRECCIEVADADSVMSVKQLVARELDVPVDQQRLVFRGKTLSDSQCLGDYNIGPDAKVHLMVRKVEKQQSSTDSTDRKDTTILWDETKKLLLKHFSPQDADKVMQNFRREFESTIASVSLDDLERMATANLQKRHFIGDQSTSS
ncbi:ubiquitin-like protein 4A [Branchiostoma lanceolatum]|uniref:UBL4A protein n=2 Tax=Branchiostoma lanceolatum TaxID=7740 RepID=A0A8J9ZZA6_BRALA|nr:UBL4A [Branchiostoma lanceolatum]